jgi:hypothetical protein
LFGASVRSRDEVFEPGPRNDNAQARNAAAASASTPAAPETASLPAPLPLVGADDWDEPAVFVEDGFVLR